MHLEPKPHTALQPDAEAPDAASLSALMDGQPDALGSACRAWCHDAAARATWHRYHLIGEALRAESLVAAPDHDAAFLQGLRARLAAEPAWRVDAVASRSWMSAGWRVPLTMAASVALVAGAMGVARMGPGVAREPALALAADGAPGLQRDARVPAMLADARLDEFLRAHQAAGGGLGAAAAGGGLRRADLLVPVSVRP